MPAGPDLRRKGAAVPLQGEQDGFASDLDAPLLIAFSVDADGSLLKIHVVVLQHAQLTDPHPGGKQELRHGGVPQGIALLMRGSGRRLLAVDRRQKRFHRM